MENKNANQKKRVTLNYIYATLIGLLVIACAVTIAFVTNQNVKTSGDIGMDEGLVVANTTYVVPLADATIVKDYSAKELQYNSTLKQWQIHKAVDLVSESSKDVLALTDGKVSNIYTNYLEGTVVEITHSNGLVSIYKSLAKEVKVEVGTQVSAGQVIGTISESMAEELNNGAHLHFEVKLSGVLVDPNGYISLTNK